MKQDGTDAKTKKQQLKSSPSCLKFRLFSCLFVFFVDSFSEVPLGAVRMQLAGFRCDGPGYFSPWAPWPA